MNLLEIEGVTHSYAPDVVVLRELDLDVPSGSNVLLIGDNGSGKSTLGRIVCGLLSPSSGEVRVEGVVISRLKAGERVRRAYYVSQVNPLQFVKSTLSAEIEFAERVAGAKMPPGMYSRFYLPEDVEANPFELSVHEAWRFGVLLACITDPSVLFIDEVPSAVNRFNLRCLRYILDQRSACGQVTFLCYQRPVPLDFDTELRIVGGHLLSA